MPTKICRLYSSYHSIIPQHLENIKRYLNSPLPHVRPVTPYKVKNMIIKCSRKKSPGFDLITVEVARWLPKKAI